MQQLRGKTQFQASSPAKQDPNSGAPLNKRTKATYRLRGIHESFDCASLERELCTYFGIEKDGLTTHSLAYDAPYGHPSRQKVATVTFQTTPEMLKAGNRWQAKILLPQAESEESCTVYFDTTFEGFTPLTAAEREADTHTDCILIHGWAGHSIGSFSSPDGDWFWPRDSLCHEMPQLRVWLYGYSSDLRDSGSVTDVYEYADNFRRALADARKSKSEVISRPLIYIVHSLGGYILQDTITRMATSDHTDDKINLSMTKGALLFGVPNQGMKSQQLISLLQEDDLPAVYTANLLDERYGSKLRVRQAHDFYKVCSRNNAIVYTFYETEKTSTVCRDAETQRWTRNGPADLLVSQASATYACPEERNMISWKSGHNDMLKLRRDDAQYETLLSRLREIIQNIERAGAAVAGLNTILERLVVADISQGQDKPSLASNIQLKSSFNKYQVPFSIHSLPVTKKFVERPAEMQLLQKTLLPGSTVDRRKIFVLRGLGGIGKTQLALEFMCLHRTKFSAVFWLDGSSKDSLKQSLARHADRIASGQMSEASRAHTRDAEGDIDVVVQEVLDWLSLTGNNTWLLVFDNVDREFDPSKPDSLAYDIEQYLPSADHGSILITTRLARMEQLGESQEVKKVNSDTAQAILKSWYKGPCDGEDSNKLLEHLDGLPLAIAQAGAYLQESGTNIKTYLRFYEDMQKNIDEILRDSHVLLRDYPNRSVWTTWNISYDSILAQDKHAAHLLVLWSFLDRIDLWYGIFEKAIASDSIVGAFSQWLGDIANQESSFRKATHLLRRYSLIESSVNTDDYSMHAVVHRWAYSYLGSKHQEDLGVLALTLVGFAIPMYTEREYASLQQRLLAHAQTCTARALGLQAVVVQNTDSNNHFADWANQQEDVLTAIHMLGLLYYDQGKLDEAEKMYMRALKGREEALGEKHRSTLDTVNNLGLLYKNQGKLSEAEKMLLRALQGYEEALGAKHISTLMTVDNLGKLYSSQGKLDEAEKMYVRALQGNEEALGAKHTSTLNTVNNLGNLYSNQGKLSEAEKMYVRALQGYEEALGAKHTSTLDTVNNLGLLYKDQGKLDEAEQNGMRALGLFWTPTLRVILPSPFKR